MTLSYTEAVERITAMQAADDAPEFSPVCRTRLFTHGHKTERAIVFFHGFTNCPRQFHELGRLFHERGYSVFIPRVPGHGLRDRMTEALNGLSREALLQTTNDALDIALGLGERVTVAGLSMGGTMAAWAAQNRNDLDLAALIAPTFGIPAIPGPLRGPFTALMRNAPGFFTWKNPLVREKWPGPKHAYPRMATRGIANIMSVGLDVLRQAQHSAPATRSMSVLTNAADGMVDNKETARLVEQWRAHGAQVQKYEFDAAHHLPHDVIDLEQPEQNTALVYPVLWEQISLSN